MDSGSENIPWFATLRDKFNTLRAEAEAVIYQEPIEFVKNQYLVASECLKEFYTELVEDTLPTFMEHTCLPHNISDIIFDDDSEGISTANYSSPLLPPEKTSDIYDDCSTEEKGDESPTMDTSDCLATYSELNNKKSNEVEEYKLPDDNNAIIAASASDKEKHSFERDLAERISWEDVPLSVLTELHKNIVSYGKVSLPDEPKSIILAKAPGNYSAERLQNLDESLIVVDSDDFCSDADVDADLEADGLSHQKTLKKKKFAKNQSGEIASKVIDEEKDANVWERFDEDFSDSDWQFV